MLSPQLATTSNNTPQYFTVSDISQHIRQTLEHSFHSIRIRGEVSGTTYHSSGHLYFTIKDENAALDIVMWRGAVSKLSIKVEDGLDVIITGDITTFAGRSKYQLNAQSLEVSGDGSLLKLLEERKQKLRAEGLFDHELKKELPFLPKVIGVISSPTGAVIRDILHRIRERCPSHVILWPAAVQGERATQEIIAAINGFHKTSPSSGLRPDVIILARGGGSIEDLWCFNDEALVRAIAASEIPTITAVGHETDTTLVDFVSDKRAPTPTAAAEMAVPVLYELQNSLANIGMQATRATHVLFDEKRKALSHIHKLLTWTRGGFDAHQQRLDYLAKRLRSPRDLFYEAEARIRTTRQRFNLAIANTVAQKQAELRRLDHVLESYSYTKTLARGFAVVRATDNTVITTAHAAKALKELSVEFQDGRINIASDKKTAPSPKKKAPRKNLNLFS